MNQKPNYGNWVPEKLLYLTFGGAALFLVLALLSGLAFSNTPLAVICAILCAVLLAFGIYMYACHECFAFGKGDMMAKVHAHLVAHLNWDGHGTLLDIGCGAAPLTVRCAKAFPDAALIGMDYWGAQWNYAKEQCEKNAAIEGVASRIHFEKGDAAHLNYADETFDAAVSNFVFHEVHSARDKRDVVLEALRVVKRGGVFSFQDLFAQKSLYGDMDTFVEELKKEGISEISRSAFFKMAKWILSALPFFFLPKIVKFSKLYSKTALRIPISIEAFKIFCKTAFLWFYKWKSNKIYILKLGSSTKFENQVAKHPF